MKKPKKRRPSRAKPGGLPKGAYWLPNGDIALKPLMSTMPNGRRLSVQGIRRAEPDLDHLAHAIVLLARAVAEDLVLFGRVLVLLLSLSLRWTVLTATPKWLASCPRVSPASRRR